MRSSTRSVINVAMLLMALQSSMALRRASATPPVNPDAAKETTIGMEGAYFLQHQGPRLEAKPFEENAPVTVRIVDATSVPAWQYKPDEKLYEFRYVGTRTGTFDLRDYLTFVDGRPATSLRPMKITVNAQLPANHIGDLEELAAVQAPRPWSYRRWVRLACIVWAFPAVAFVVLRILRRKKAPPPVVVETLSTEAELRALVDIALAGGLDTAKQARLEELLIRYWRESLDAGTTPTLELIARLKRDPRTAPLIAQLETWLYQRPKTESDGSAVDVERLLAPYRGDGEVGTPIASGRSSR